MATDSTFPLDNPDLLKNILSFVGENQYRFVAVINRRFHEAYLETFPRNFVTYFTASTEKHARIAWDELHPHRIKSKKGLCRSAAMYGCLPALQFLRSVDCPWDERTCSEESLSLG